MRGSNPRRLLVFEHLAMACIAEALPPKSGIEVLYARPTADPSYKRGWEIIIRAGKNLQPSGRSSNY
jgi:hypothetical protein